MPAFSSQACSIGERSFVSSTFNKQTSKCRHEHCSIDDLLVEEERDIATENLYHINHKFYAPTPRNTGSSKFRKRMEAKYPNHLAPVDHPILELLQPQTTLQNSMTTLRTPTTVHPSSDCSEQQSVSNTVSGITKDGSGRRKSKRATQPLGRYRTTPVTLEEIREIDEELYAKQHPSENEEQNGNNAIGRHKLPRNFLQNTKPNLHLKTYNVPDFKCTYMKKTTLMPGRILWPLAIPNNSRHRSHENLAYSSNHALPTIPEERRQQQQTQKPQGPFSQTCSNNEPLITEMTSTITNVETAHAILLVPPEPMVISNSLTITKSSTDEHDIDCSNDSNADMQEIVHL